MLTRFATRPTPSTLYCSSPRPRRAGGFWRLRFLCALWLGLGLSACGEGNNLGGSMDTVFSLDFTGVQVTFRQKSLVVQYTDGADVVCQVVIDTQAVPLAANATVSGAPFAQTVSLYRAAASGGSFPDVSGGTLTLGDYGTTPGSAVSGKFNATLADGHTLIGAFNGTLKAVVQ